jgi:hypothetical protein
MMPVRGSQGPCDSRVCLAVQQGAGDQRVARRGQLLADALDADGVESHERDGEPGPHLVPHLLQHVPRGDDEDPLAAAAPDELGQDHADFEALAEADRVGEQDARA